MFKYIKRFFSAFAGGIKAMLMGQLLLKLKIERFFIHILYTFLMFWLAILCSMMVQNTLVEIEKNKAIISEMKIYHAQKTLQLVKMGRFETVEQQLSRRGSKVTSPEKPAVTIE